jgi:hypothetical protein
MGGCIFHSIKVYPYGDNLYGDNPTPVNRSPSNDNLTPIDKLPSDHETLNTILPSIKPIISNPRPLSIYIASQKVWRPIWAQVAIDHLRLLYTNALSGDYATSHRDTRNLLLAIFDKLRPTEQLQIRQVFKRSKTVAATPHYSRQATVDLINSLIEIIRAINIPNTP